MLVSGWVGASLTGSLDYWCAGSRFRGERHRFAVHPLARPPGHAHAAHRRTSRPDLCRPKTGPGGQPDRAPEPDPGPSTQRAAAAGCLVEPTQAASSSTRPLPRRGLHPVPPTHAHFQEYCLTFAHVPRVSYFLLLLALQGASCAILLCLVQASIQVSRMLSAPPQALKPKAKNHLGRGHASARCLPRHAPMPCHVTHMHAPVLPAAAAACHLNRHWGPRLDVFLSRRSDAQGRQSIGSKWESHDKRGQARQADERAQRKCRPQATARRHNPQYSQPLSTTGSQPRHIPHPPPRLLDEGSAGAGTRQALVSRGVALLMCVSANGVGRVPRRRQLL